MGLSARWAGVATAQTGAWGGRHGGPVTLGRADRCLTRLGRGRRGWCGATASPEQLRVRSPGGRPAGATPGGGLSPGARGAGSRRCQELRRLALIEREERALRPGYNSSLFSVIALAREQVPWRHLEPEMSIDLLRL